MDEMLKRLIARRQKADEARTQTLAKRTAITDLAAEEAREDLSDEEDAEFRGLTEQIKTHDEELRALDARISELSEELQRSGELTKGAAAVQRAQARVQVVEGQTYAKGNGNSYFRDLAAASINTAGASEARARLERHAIDVATAPEYRAGLDRVDTSGGYFVPPAWLISQYVAFNRAGRATADLCTQQALPSGTDSINIPKIATGTTVGLQATDNGSVTETDAVDAVVTAGVKTIAGQQTVAQQLLDQSPVNFDEVIFRDLGAAYNNAVGSQVINGSDASGQVEGILLADNILALTFTSTAPTVKALYSHIADSVQRIHSQRYDSPTHIVMHPRRWAWLLNAFDLSDRPLITPSGPTVNALGTFDAVGSQQVVGHMQGLPVVTDPNIPTNKGSGTNEDVVIVMKSDDCLLFESSMRARALPEVLSNTLSVRLQVYGYIAFTAERNPKGIAVISGTGLVAPTF